MAWLALSATAAAGGCSGSNGEHEAGPSGTGGTLGAPVPPAVAGSSGVGGATPPSGQAGATGLQAGSDGTTGLAGAAGSGAAGAGAGGAGSGGAGGSSGAGGDPGAAAAGMGGGGGSASSGMPVPSAGCGKTSTLSFEGVPGESGQNVGVGAGGYVTIQSSGETRGFALRLPDDYDPNHPYWLFFGFHWNGGNSKEVDTGGSNGYVSAHFGLQKLSNNGAIFVAPQGLGNAWPNAGGRDLQFVDDMVKLLEDNYCVDTSHLITNGFSYGGGMTYELACARAKVFRAAAIYEGAQLSGCDGGNDPIALWQMVGLEDNICGLGLATPLRDRFVQNNGCTPRDPPQPPMAPPYVSPGGHICTDFEGCSDGHPLRWCVHQSGHGYAIVDGTGDLYNSCATAPKTCSPSCPCSWVADDVWAWLTAL